MRDRWCWLVAWLALVAGRSSAHAQPDIERCADLTNCPAPAPKPPAPAPTPPPAPACTDPATCPDAPHTPTAPEPDPPPESRTPACADPAKCPTISEREPERDRTLTRGGGLRVDLELSSVIKLPGDQLVDAKSLTMVRGHASMSWGRPHVRWYFALDVALGASIEDVGFGYDLQFLPLGIGFQLRRPERTAFIGIAAGIGVSGAPPALPSAGTLPVQLMSAFRLSEKLNLLVRGRAVRFINATTRDNGSPSASFADELDAMAAIQRAQYHYLEGRYFGVAYRETQGARFVGIVFGTGGAEEIMQE